MSKGKSKIVIEEFVEGYTSVTFIKPDGFTVTFDFKDALPMTGNPAQRRVADKYPHLFRMANRAVAW
jgi:hypothetical protein